jgi:hypothetical protein
MGQRHTYRKQTLMSTNRDIITIRFIILPHRLTGQINVHSSTSLSELSLQLQETITTRKSYKLVFECKVSNHWVLVQNQQEWSKIIAAFQANPHRIEPLFVRITLKRHCLHVRREKVLPSVQVPSEQQYQYKARRMTITVPEKKVQRIDTIRTYTPQTPQKLNFNELFEVILERDMYAYRHRW